MNISNNSGIDSNDLAKRGESLIRKSTNRYLYNIIIDIKNVADYIRYKRAWSKYTTTWS